MLLSRFPQSCRHFHNAETGTQYLVSPSLSPTCSLSPPLSRGPASCGSSQCEPGVCCQDNMGTVMMLLSTLLLVQYEVCAPLVQQCLFVPWQAGHSLHSDPHAMYSPVVWQCHL